MLTTLLPVGLAFVFLYVAYKTVYNIYFHPLAKYPGPKRAKISNVWYAKHWLGGRWPFVLEELHKKYGPVVRFSPNDLSFISSQAYQDIHGHRKHGQSLFTKSEWYTVPGLEPSIVSERDPAKHREIRKLLSHAFSAKSLRVQEDVVIRYDNMFIEQVKKKGNEALDVEQWFVWLTFDIIGDLAFGESFGAVENAHGHPAIETILSNVHAATFIDICHRLPLLKTIIQLMPSKKLIEEREYYQKFSRDRAKKRLAMGNDREDFFGHLLSDKANNVTVDFLSAQSDLLLIAGSETTSTALTGMAYHLLNAPQTLQRLTHEVRSAFNDAKQITGDSTQSLPYLFAVIEEGLRIFPPLAAGMYRVSPGAVVDGEFVPEGTKVSTSAWSAGHSENYFFKAREFHPERWLSEDHPHYDPAFKGDDKAASKPFILGSRTCLGINLAYMEMRMILARLVWEFDWELESKDLDFDAEVKLVFLWYKPAVNIRFTPVKR